MVILQLVRTDDTGDSCYRMRWPAKALSAQDPSLTIINLDGAAVERFAWGSVADLLVIFQSLDFDLLPIIELRRKKGLKTLVEYNDNFYSPPPSSPIVAEWQSPLVWGAYEQFLTRADAVMVTGPGLHQLFSSKTAAPIFEIPNFLPSSPPSFSSLWEKKGSQPRIGWAGSVGHAGDVLYLARAFQEIARRFPTVHFEIMGNETFPTLLGLPEERLSFTPWGSMDQYFAFWERQHIGIIPLLDTPYNRCRSDIKAVEIARCGARPLLPALLPYDVITTEWQLTPFHSVDELVHQVSTLLQHPELLLSEAFRCHEWVTRHRAPHHEHERRNLYRALLPKESYWKAHQQTTSATFSPGFYELSGTPTQQTPTFSLMKEAEKLFRSGRGEEAHSLLLGKGEWLHPDRLILLLRVERALGIRHVLTSVLAERSMEEHPRDLRVLLELLAQTKEGQQAEQLFDELLRSFSEGGEETCRFFFKAFMEVIGRHPGAGRLVEPRVSHLLTLFPSSLAVKELCAAALEEHGQYAEARTLLEEVLQEGWWRAQEAPYTERLQLPYLGSKTEELSALEKECSSSEEKTPDALSTPE